MEKILVYALSENVGGIENYVLNLTRYNTSTSQVKFGYIVLGEKTPYSNEIAKYNSSLYYIPTRKKFIPNIIKSFFLFKKLRKEYSIVYFNTSSIGYIVPYIFAILFKYKIYLHAHSDASKTSSEIKKIIHKMNYRIVRRWIDKRFCCSTEAAKWMFLQDYSMAKFIPNAIEVGRFSYNETYRKDIRQLFDIGDALVIGNIGRLYKLKNQELLIDILAEINRSINTYLLLVGDGEDKQLLIERATSKKVSNKVIFTGQVAAPEKYLSAMDCFVMPSLTEGFPTVIVEAQASGIPCVCSDCITKEVNISGNVAYVSLNQPVAFWKDTILKSLGPRYDCREELINADFDVRSSVPRITKYLKLSGVEYEN